MEALQHLTKSVGLAGGKRRGKQSRSKYGAKRGGGLMDAVTGGFKGAMGGLMNGSKPPADAPDAPDAPKSGGGRRRRSRKHTRKTRRARKTHRRSRK